MPASLSVLSAADTHQVKIPFPSSSSRLQLKSDYDLGDAEQIGEKDRVYIAVLGASGSGKSSFINAVTGSKLEVYHDLEPCAHPVKLGNEFELDGRFVTLIDTPGLDVSTGANIMRGVFAALEAPLGIKLHGVIFLQSISAELPEFSRQLFSLSQNLCIEKDLRKLVIVKTSWAEAGITPARIEALEQQVDSFFKPAQARRASIVRYDFDLDSKATVLESTRCLFRPLLERVDQSDNQSTDEDNVSSTESTIPPAQLKFAKAPNGKAHDGKRKYEKRYHKNAPFQSRRRAFYAQKLRARLPASETARRRRNRDDSNLRDGIQRLFGEQRGILAKMEQLKARLRRMTK